MVGPLIKECTIREEQLSKYRARTEELSRQVKMLRAILQFPALTSQFRQSCKKVNINSSDYSVEQLLQKMSLPDAVHTLRSYGCDEKNNNTAT